MGKVAAVAGLTALALVGSPLAAVARASVRNPGMTPVSLTVNAAAPNGPVNEGLVGTNQPVAGAGPMMQAIGVHWARTDFSLDSAYNCTTGVWSPLAVDQRVEEDLQTGGDPELIFDYSPGCMTTYPGHENLEPPDADGYGPWRALVERAAYHEMVTFGVHIFEVWNEPDGTFWYGTIADYLAMYKNTAEAVEAAAAKAHMHNVLIGGPALLYSDPAWLGPFLEYVHENHLPLGFVSWHYYGDYPALGPFGTSAGTLPPDLPEAGPYWYNPLTRAQSYSYGVDLVKAMLAEHPDLRPLTVIDEWNLDAGYDPRSDYSYDAAFVAAVLDACQGAGLDRMDFFRVADDAPGTLGNWGMLFSNLRPKPVYWAFLFWHAIAGRLLPVALSPDQEFADPQGRIGAVASRSNPNSVSVLLYDYAPYDPTGGYGKSDPNSFDHAVEVAVDGLGDGRWSYSLRMIDATVAGSVVAGGRLAGDGKLKIDLPGESVALLQLSRASAS